MTEQKTVIEILRDLYARTPIPKGRRLPFPETDDPKLDVEFMIRQCIKFCILEDAQEEDSYYWGQYLLALAGIYQRARAETITKIQKNINKCFSHLCASCTRDYCTCTANPVYRHALVGLPAPPDGDDVWACEGYEPKEELK